MILLPSNAIHYDIELLHAAALPDPRSTAVWLRNCAQPMPPLRLGYSCGVEGYSAWPAKAANVWLPGSTRPSGRYIWTTRRWKASIAATVRESTTPLTTSTDWGGRIHRL